jgi:hypothetical protein
MKFNESILLQLTPKDFCVFEDRDNIPERVDRALSDPRFNYVLEMDEDDERFGKHCGGRFDWTQYANPGHNDTTNIMKVQLVRVWCTQMYTQMAAELSYTDQVSSTIKTGLTEEELDLLAKINNKLIGGIYDEMWGLNKTFVEKKNIKKINLAP